VASVHNLPKHAITKIPDKLWDEIVSVLPKEKPDNAIGRPIVPYRKVMDGILCILRTGCQWKMLPSEYGSGSTCHRRFQEWVQSDIFRKIWIRLLQSYDITNKVSSGHGNRLTAYP
jgi:transposase